jgi:hypothetical protein
MSSLKIHKKKVLQYTKNGFEGKTCHIIVVVNVEFF